MAQAVTDTSSTSAPKPVKETQDLDAILGRLRAAHKKAGSPSERVRMERLTRLQKMLVGHKDRLADAVSADFGNRSRHETLVAEVFVTASLIKYTKENLRGWMEPERREVAMTFFPARNELRPQPLGVIGIISPWNYPVQLALAPLVSALAAGNRAMIKPSELVPRTAALLDELVSQTFADDEVVVVTGGVEVGEAFSKLAFDHLVFTGSTRVGKIVMKAAAENLVPVTLELGGKSPTIVAPDFPIAEAAATIISGKLYNSGQTCVAPDYAFVKEGKEDEFIAEAKAAVARMYPTLEQNPDYTALITPQQKKRLEGYLTEAAEKGAKVIRVNPAGESFEGSRKMEPAIVLGATDDMRIMQDELFGPVLPVKTYRDLAEAVDYVNDHPRPLALYVFSRDERTVDRVLDDTVSGGVCVNEVMVHVAQDDLPFGGVGASGMGAYHGREGFDTMSKRKPVFHQARINGTSLFRPPYKKTIDTALRLLLGK